MTDSRSAAVVAGSSRTRLNGDWRFEGDVHRPGRVDHLDLDVARARAACDLDDSSWETVTVAHTTVPLSWKRWDAATWETVSAYRRHFDTPAEAAGKRVFIEFEGAMTTAVVTLNDTVLGQHRGGYLPFGFELTEHLRNSGNTLGVLLDARFNQNLPPNLPSPAPSNSIDYWQPGGIHRDVWIRVVPATFVSSISTTHYDVMDDGKRRSVFGVTVNSATVQSDVAVAVDLVDSSGRSVATAHAERGRLAVGETEIAVDVGLRRSARSWVVESVHRCLNPRGALRVNRRQP